MKTLTLSEADAKALAKLLAAKWAQSAMLEAAVGAYNHPFLVRGTRHLAGRIRANRAECKLLGKALAQLGYDLPVPRVGEYVRPLTEQQQAHEHYKGYSAYFIALYAQRETVRMVKGMGL